MCRNAQKLVKNCNFHTTSNANKNITFVNVFDYTTHTIISVNGYLTEWSGFTKCVPCGKGKVTRTRQCVQPKYGGKACPAGDLTETKSCLIKHCPSK